MKVRTNRLDKPNRTTSERHRRSLLAAAAIALGGSLLLLLGAGWLQHGVSKMAISGLGALLLIGALTGIFRTLDFSMPRLVHGSPRQLAWIRIVVCLTAVIYTVIEDLPAIASLPVAMQSNYQFYRLLNMLPGYSALLANPNLLGILQWTTAALLFLGLIGFQTRATLFLGGVGFLLIEAILRQYTYFFHSGLVLVYLTLLLPWTPCAATWSFDRWLNPQMRQPRAQSVGFSVYVCFTVMAVIYLLCGLSKMRDSGLDWFRGDNIEQKLIRDALKPLFLATLENGSSIVIPIRDYFPAALPNSRFFLMKAFTAPGRRSKIFDQFFAGYVQRRNRNLTFGSAISSIEVQQWRWNYAVDPNDPRLGWVIAVYPFDATAKASPPR
jgi:hypothetical protein